MITASPAHASIMAAVHGAVFPDEPWDAASFASLLAQPGMFGWLDERGGLLLLRIVADEAEIITIGAVTKRRGIGRTLLQVGLEQARSQGVTMLHLEVAAGNAPARRLYEVSGFQQAGLRKHYYANGEDAVVMSLTL
ncbi:MAG TPA: GNAT family N-acetyltransferase [Acidocella sp.]|nr:GNAT family N-acetyltransferase [Acidocella sp.]